MFSLRDATENDLASIEEIYRIYVETSIATFEEPGERSTDFPSLFQTLKHKGLPFIVATEPGSQQIVGYAFAKAFHVRAAYRFTVEDSIYIHPSRTGQGLGPLMLRELIARLKNTSVQQIVSYMSIMPDEDENHSATCRLHRSCGFVPAGRLKSVGFKLNKWIDVACYQLSLGTPST